MRSETATKRFAGDLSGAVADLGVLIPLVAALVVKNGLDAGTALVCAGALYVLAGAYFKVPVPVQPIKAAAAIAITKGLAPSTLSAAGILLGAILLAMGLSTASQRLMRLFAAPIVRGLQLGVGLILVRTGFRLAEPGAGAATYGVALAIAAVLLVSTRAAERRPIPLLIVAAGIAYSVIATSEPLRLQVALFDPEISTRAFRPAVLWTALTMLVIPQIPLTFGNAVVAVSDLGRKYFGEHGRRVTPTAVTISSGVANVLAGSIGGMPMCHGSGGLTAHVRAGARTNRMNFVIGGALLALGLFFGPTALDLLALIPAAVLMGFLVFTGVLHGALAFDRRGRELVIALAMGAAGVLTGNLAVSLLLGFVAYWPAEIARRRRPRR